MAKRHVFTGSTHHGETDSALDHSCWCGCVVALFVLEVTRRVYNPFYSSTGENHTVLQANRTFVYDSQPAHGTARVITYRTNSLGFRRPEPPAGGLGSVECDLRRRRHHEFIDSQRATYVVWTIGIAHSPIREGVVAQQPQSAGTLDIRALTIAGGTTFCPASRDRCYS